MINNISATLSEGYYVNCNLAQNFKHNNDDDLEMDENSPIMQRHMKSSPIAYSKNSPVELVDGGDRSFNDI